LGSSADLRLRNAGCIDRQPFLGLSELNILSDTGAKARKRGYQHPKPPSAAIAAPGKCRCYGNECETRKYLDYRTLVADGLSLAIDERDIRWQLSGERGRNVAEISAAASAKFAGFRVLRSAFWTKHIQVVVLR
jgi:hypothetical protein